MYGTENAKPGPYRDYSLRQKTSRQQVNKKYVISRQR